MKNLSAIVALGVMILSLSSCLPRSFHKWYADYKGDVGQEYMVQDSRNRILSYDWYFDQFAQIQAQIANIESLGPEALERSGMIRVVNAMIGEYNAKSKQYNHNLWKAKDLPYEIDFYKGVSK